MNFVCRTSQENQELFKKAAEIIGIDVSFKVTAWNDIINVYTTNAKPGLLYKAHGMLTTKVSTGINGKDRLVNRYTNEEIKAACVS